MLEHEERSGKRTRNRPAWGSIPRCALRYGAAAERRGDDTTTTMQASNESLRTTAELTDDGELLPPELRERGETDGELAGAVRDAISEEPNALDRPMLWEPEEYRSDGASHAIGYLTASYNELPVCDDDGGLVGWTAPYRAREDVETALRETLPEGVRLERVDGSTTVFYRR